MDKGSSMANPIMILNQRFVNSEGFFKVLRPENEWDVDIDAPQLIIDQLRTRRIPRVDVFSFRQRLPHTEPAYDFFYAVDNTAAIPITSYEDWWKGVNHRVRLKVKKAQRLGVTVRSVSFDDDLVSQMKQIFDDDPLRQGVPFRLYQKSPAFIKEKMGTFADRADFFCAYHESEPIGILKMVYSGSIARMMTIIGKISSRDKAPVNALLAKAVDRCVEKSVHFLTYGQFYYGRKGFDSVAQFKLHNGFKKYDLPHYYIPLTGIGRIYIALRLYKDPNERIPESVARPMRAVRDKLYAIRH